MSKSRPSSCMDSPPSFEDLAQQQEAIQRDHDELAVFEAEIAGVKGEGFPDNPFFGTSAADVKARRHARGAYAREDYDAPADPIDSYAGPRSGSEVRTWDDLRAHTDYRMALAREQYPDDFQEVVFGTAIPKLREAGLDENDPKVQQWLSNDSFADELYEYGLQLQGRRPSDDPPRRNHFREQKRLGGIENLVDFARELEALKAKW